MAYVERFLLIYQPCVSLRYSMFIAWNLCEFVDREIKTDNGDTYAMQVGTIVQSVQIVVHI